MNFKEALIAHLQGEKVECRLKENGQCIDFMSEFEDLPVHAVMSRDYDSLYTFRLAPRTILVNGVEVPAPEQDAPDYGATYYVPMPSWADLYAARRWENSGNHIHSLKCGLVYLNKDDAINRAKAMLITQEAV